MKETLLTLALFLLIPACSPPPPVPPPNIIIVHVDDLGWTDLSSFGSDYYQTPHIDQLAASGMRFTNAYAAAAICSPSRAALLTGHYPARLGITDWIRASFQGDAWRAGTPVEEYVTQDDRTLDTPRNQPYLPLAETTIAEAMKESGYVTAHIGKWHLGLEDWYPEKQGFDYNFGGCDFGQPPSYFDPYVNNRVNGIPTLPSRKEGEYLTDREADEAVGFINQHQDQSFFLYYAPYAVHTPIQAKPEVKAEYEARPKTNHTNAAYAAMVESVDDAVGDILKTLEELELSDRTIVLFTSDNGGLEPVTDNAPLREGKGSPYEGGIRVPLIVKWDGVIKPGTESDHPVSSIDHFPTLAELAGVAAPQEVDGTSYSKVLTAQGGTETGDLFWHFPHYRGYNHVGPYSIVRSGDWKLIRFYDLEAQEVEPILLFNLHDDLGETRNLAAEQPESRQELEQKLDAWLESVNARMPR